MEEMGLADQAESTLSRYAQILDRKFDSLIEGISQGERDEWLNHPLTECIILLCQAEEVAIAEGWAAGDYTSEDGGDTLQMNSRELGRCQALGMVQEHIRSLRTPKQEEEDSVFLFEGIDV